MFVYQDIGTLGAPPTPDSTADAIGAYVAGLRDTVVASKAAAISAYNGLKKVRADLDLPFMSGPVGEGGGDGNGWSPDLEQQAVDITAMANLLIAAADDVLAQKRRLFWDDQMKNFAIEGFATDTLRLQTDANGVPVLVDAAGSPQHVTGQVGVAPIIVFGVVALAVVQALILYLLIDQALKTVQVIAEQKTQKTLAEAVKKHADLVATGKATAEDAAKLNKSMYDGATSLQKEQTSSQAAKKGFESDTLKTLGYIALGLGILYAIVKFIPSPSSRARAPALPATNPRKKSFSERAVLQDMAKTLMVPASALSIDDGGRGLSSFGEGTFYYVENAGRGYVVAPDDDAAHRLAIAVVTQDLEQEPEIFNQSFLESYIDEDRLRRELQSDVEESNRDYAREMSERELVAEANRQGIDVEENEDGEPADVDKVVDDVAEAMTNDQLRNPLEYLEEIYGDEATKRAIEIAGIDVREAAEAAVRDDGEGHFLSHYDGEMRETAGGRPYWRTD